MPTPIDRGKLLSLGVISRRSGNRVTETRDGKGRLVKATTDEAGNTVTEHWHDRQDVMVRPQTVQLVREGRDEPARRP